MRSVVALVAAAAAFCSLSAHADTSSRAASTFYFLGPWKVQEVKNGLVRQLKLNFTAGVDEWTLQSPVQLYDEDASQLGIVSVRAGDNGIGSVWASRGLLLGDVEVQAETDIDAEGDLPDMPPTHDEALVHIMDFSWVQVQRVPVGTKHGVDGAATHHSDVGDILALALASGSTHVQWLAVREKDPSTTTFWQTYQWWIMGAIFVANLGLRSWARGRGRSDAAPAPPSMEEARAARRGKSKSKSS